VSQERWQKVEELFRAAMERAPGDRSVWLENACKDDPDIRRIVELLLARETQADEFPLAPTQQDISLSTRPGPLLGSQLGPYHIVSPLGAGGMGEVYRGHDTKLGRDVAIKTLPPEFARDADRLARLRREARTLAALNHPNIAAIYGLEQSGDVDFLVLELVEGETLAEQIEKKGPLPIERVLDCARQVAEALESAHGQGIVHRDLKPGNVKITPQGRIKVLDFGLAKALRANELSQDLSRTMVESVPPAQSGIGHIVGTPSYMSPEQALGLDADKPMDIWAFGCLLYELLSGRRAFKGLTARETLAAVLDRDPDWGFLPRKTPRQIRDLLHKCLEKDAQHRPQDISEVRNAIAAVQRRSRRSKLDPFSAARRRKARHKRIRALAVLPLTNLSSDPEHEYFADGMTDAFITTLAQLGALRVISRTSVMQYKHARKPLPDIARELNVDAVLEGTVLRSADRVRIAAQLIDAATDTHLWAKNYESDLRDILTVQNEVAQAVAQEVRIKLTPQEQARFAVTRHVEPAAYEDFLKGRFYWYKRSPDALKQSLEHLQRAIALDETYPLAHAGLADTYISLGWDLYAAMPPAEAYSKATQSLNKALQLEPNCAEAHVAQAWVSAGYHWDWNTAEMAFRQGLGLMPQYGPGHIWYSHFLHAMGRFEEAHEESRRAIACDPLGLILNLHLGWYYTYQREHERAIIQLKKTIDLEPRFILARLFLGEAYEQLGRWEPAIKEFDKAVDLSGRHPVYLAGLGHAYAASGRAEGALKIIEELQQLSRHIYVPARGIAEIYIGLNERQQAFSWLDKAVEQRNGWLLHIESNPRYDSLRSDPRYVDVVRRVGLPPHRK
jgi:serine/threonine protein kinase/tetratricopeptide (TPR) repeat protein